MSTRLPFLCENCGSEGTIELEEDLTYIEAISIMIKDRCCTFCNGNLTAHSGVYVRNTDGLLERVSDV